MLGEQDRGPYRQPPRRRAALLIADVALLRAAALIGTIGPEELSAFGRHLQHESSQQDPLRPDPLALLRYLIGARARLDPTPIDEAAWITRGRQTQRVYVQNRFLRWGEGIAERVLFLRHGADCGPLLHIAIYLALLLGLRFYGDAVPLPLWSGLWVILTMLSFSLTIGINHLHAHRNMFRAWLPNKVVEILICLPALLTSAEMTIFHVRQHHRENDGPGDAASTQPFRSRLGALYYFVATIGQTSSHGCGWHP